MHTRPYKAAQLGAISFNQPQSCLADMRRPWRSFSALQAPEARTGSSKVQSHRLFDKHSQAMTSADAAIAAPRLVRTSAYLERSNATAHQLDKDLHARPAM